VDAGISPEGPRPEESTIAAGHGARRLRLGFSLDSVVREYGALRETIVATARDEGAQLTLREVEVVFDCIVVGIARGVSEYTHQCDAELLRQGNEHFAFIAPELRNPLSSATLAFQLLKNKGQLPAESRSVGALERGLQRTNELVEQTLQLARVASGIELRRRIASRRRHARAANTPPLHSERLRILDEAFHALVGEGMIGNGCEHGRGHGQDVCAGQ
jgi:signal transduction histidine kinase